MVENISVCASEQVWVAGITYIKTMEGYSYLSLITDAYSRKIVGHCLYPSLGNEECIEALNMALSNRLFLERTLVHHFDRGVQCCSGNYVDISMNNDIAISMIQNGSPYENALAERMNEIIKSEFIPRRCYQNHNEAAHLKLLADIHTPILHTI